MRFWEEKAFTEAVTKHFSFLCGEYGFRCKKRGDTYALYQSRKIYMRIVYFPGLCHIYIEIGHRYLANRYYDALDLLKFKDTEANKYMFEAKNEDILAERLEKLAAEIHSKLSDVLQGNTELFREVRKSRREMLSFNDYYFQRLGFRKQYYVNNETGRRYTEAEHSAYGALYIFAWIVCLLTAMSLQIPAGYYSLIFGLGILLYPFKYFFTTFEEYMDPEEEDRYRYW